jgi:hypothetical protein
MFVSGVRPGATHGFLHKKLPLATQNHKVVVRYRRSYGLVNGLTKYDGKAPAGLLRERHWTKAAGDGSGNRTKRGIRRH